jgi:hypothetical protein
MARGEASMRARAGSAAALAFVAALLLSSVGARADALGDEIAAIDALEKAGDDTKCVARLAALTDWSDPRVAAAVRDLAKSPKDAVACAAIKALATHKDAKALEWLKKRIADEDLAKPKDKGGRPDVYRAVLDACLLWRDPSTLKPLETAVDAFLTTDADYATRAIRAYGSVREKAVVGRLIEWLADLDMSHGGKSSGGSGGRSRYSPETQKIRDNSAAVLVKTLADATDQDFPDTAAWRKWWTENARTFEFPKTDAVPVDVTTLTEWTDKRYGYTVKRPAGAGWTFKPGDTDFRIQLLHTDAQNLWVSMVGWNVYRSAGSSLKDVDAFAGWWMTKQFPDKEFEKYGQGGEPSAVPRTIGGREWTLVTARGLAKGSMSNRGAMERRVYITKIDSGYLYAWAVVKTTASDEEKRLTWEAAEKTAVLGK